jgi:hypothetical protein
LATIDNNLIKFEVDGAAKPMGRVICTLWARGDLYTDNPIKRGIHATQSSGNLLLSNLIACPGRIEEIFFSPCEKWGSLA